MAVFSSLRDAVDTVVKAAKRLFPDARIEVEYVNYGRHAIVAIDFGSRVERLYVVFVREPFHLFCKYFPDWCRVHGHDEALTINWEVLHSIVVPRGITAVLYFLADGRVYRVPTKLFLELEQVLCRYQKKERLTKVCHVPLKLAELVADYGRGVPLKAFA